MLSSGNSILFTVTSCEILSIKLDDNGVTAGMVLEVQVVSGPDIMGIRDATLSDTQDFLRSDGLC